MGRYQLARAADDDLTTIYTYSFNQFRERQADSYFESLEESLSRLAENPQLGIDIGRVRAAIARLLRSTPWTSA